MPSDYQKRLEYALKMASEGWQVIPVQKGSKEPFLKESWKRMKTTDPAVIRQWFSQRDDMNYGLVPPPGYAVVDLDIKEGVDGVKAFEALEAEQGVDGIVSTFEVSTPSGGKHLYFKTDNPVGNANSFANGIDVRGADSGYVVGPMCQVNGGVYEPVNGAKVATAPEWIVRQCGAPADRSEDKLKEPVGGWDPEGSEYRAREFLKHRAPAVEGDNGDDWAYKTAAMVHDLGVSPEKCLAIMEEDGGWNSRNDPPFDPAELERKVRNGYLYAQNQPGSKSGAMMDEFEATADDIAIEDVEQKNAAAEEQARQILGKGSTIGDALARDPQPVREIIPGMIERGIVTMLKGPGQSNKSRLTLQILISVAAGSHPASQPPHREKVEQCSTVFFSAEDSADETDRRIKAIVENMGTLRRDCGFSDWRDAPFRIHTLAGTAPVMWVVHDDGRLERTPLYRAVRDYLRSIPGHKLVGFDSAYDFSRFAGSAKLDEDSVNRFIKAGLQGLCDETDSTMIVIQHPSQAGLERGDFSGWSVANFNAPRAILGIAPLVGVKDAYELSVVKRNHGPVGRQWRLFYHEGALVTPDYIATMASYEEMLYRATVSTAILKSALNEPETKKNGPSRSLQMRVGELLGKEPAREELSAMLALAVKRGHLEYIERTKNGFRAGYHEVGLTGDDHRAIIRPPFSKKTALKRFHRINSISLMDGEVFLPPTARVPDADRPKSTNGNGSLGAREGGLAQAVPADAMEETGSDNDHDFDPEIPF